jgi:integration host factor subunit beta
MISKKDCARVVDAFLEAIRNRWSTRRTSRFAAFGTFKIRRRKTAWLVIPELALLSRFSARPVPGFKPSKELRALVAAVEFNDSKERGLSLAPTDRERVVRDDSSPFASLPHTPTSWVFAITSPRSPQTAWRAR